MTCIRSLSGSSRPKSLVSLFLLALLMTLALVPLTNAHAATITLVQQNSVFAEVDTPPNNPVTISFSSSVTKGDVIVVAFDIENQATPPSTVISVTDTLGTSYTQASGSPSIYPPSEGSAYIYYGVAYTGGSDTITIANSVEQYTDIFIYEVSGVTTVGAASMSGSSSSGETATLSTASTTFTSPAFLVATTQTDDEDTCTPGTGFTCSPEPSGDSYGLTEYAVGGVSSPTTFPMTLNRADNWDYVGLALPAGVPPPQPSAPVVLVCPGTKGGTLMPAGATFTDTYGNTWLAPSGQDGSGGTWASYFFPGPESSIPLAMISGWGGDYGTYNGQQGWIVTFYC